MTLPSVTQVLGRWQDFSAIRPEILAYAAERGSVAHRVCASYATAFQRSDWLAMGLIKGGVGVPEEVRGYVKSFIDWFDLAVAEVLFVEAEVVSAFGYVGHFDLGVRLKDGRLALIDLKTPVANQKIWALQLAAYWGACIETFGVEFEVLFSLRLNKDGGEAKLKPYDNHPQHLAIFLGGLNMFRFLEG